MRRYSSPRSLIVCAAFTAGACTVSDKSQNAYDPSTPPSSEATATLTGTVTVEPPETGPADASGVLVSLEGANVTARTGPGGTFQLVAVPPGTYILNLSKAGYETVRTAPVQVPLWYSTETSVNLGTFLLSLARGTIGGTAHLEGESTADGISVSVSGTAHVTTTNGTGQYVLSQVPIGTYTVTFHKAAFVDQSLTSVTVADQATTTEPDVTLAANPGSITGTVLLPGSASNAGVTVLVTGTTLDGNPSTANGNTDSTGAFQITTVPAGVYQVLFQATGYASQQVSTAVAPANPSNLGTITLAQATGTIFGTVTLDDNTDSSGTTVLLYATNGGNTLDGGVGPADGGSAGGNPIASAVTLQDGSYTLTNVPVGSYSLSYSHGGYAPVTLSGISVAANQVTTPANTILTSQPATIMGQVFLNGAAAGADLSGTQITIPGTSVQGTTATDGTFQLDGVSTGQHDVQISRMGYVSVTLLVSTTPGEVVTLPPQTLLVALGAIGGTITAAERMDASGILVTLAGGVAGYTAVTDPTGTYLIQNVPVGTYTLLASLAGYQPYSSVTFQVVDGQTTASAATSATLSLLTTASVVGTVLADGALNQSGATVLLSGADLNGQPVSGSAVSQTGGGYAIDTLPQGNYAVTFQLSGYTSVSLPPTAVGAGLQVTLPTVTLERATGSYAGSVTATAGSTGMTITTSDSAGASVVVTDPSLTDSYAGVTDSSGDYGIGPIPAPLAATTAYTITASKPNFTSATTTAILTAGSNPVMVSGLTLAAAGFNVTGCVIVPPPVADSSGVTIWLAGAAFNGTTYTNPGNGTSTVPAGGCGGSPTGATYSFSNVPNGTYTVSLSEAGYGAAALSSITVSNGDVALPVATLGRATGTITGTVTASAGGTGLIVDPSAALVQVTGAGLTGPLQATTDPTGTYTIVGVPVNPAGTPYTISVSKPNYVAGGTTTAAPLAGTTVSAASTLTLTVALTSVTGTVIVPQPPAANSSGVTATLAGVAFNGASFAPVSGVVSNAAGAYTFTNDVPPGTYSVTLTLDAFSTATIQGVVVTAGATATVPTTTLVQATGTITGTVVASAGSTGLTADPSSALIQVTGAGLSTPITGLSGPAGTYTIAGVPVSPAGTPYTVSASKLDYVAAGTTTVTPVANVTVSAAGAIDLNIATSTVSGTVTVPSPAATSAGVTATLSGEAFNGAAFAPTTTPLSIASGAYTFGNTVPPGTYTVTLSLFGYNSATISGLTVAAGSPTVIPATALTQATGTISGSVTTSASGTGITTDPGSVLITVSGSGVSVTGTTTPSGSYLITGVPINPAGTPYTITASKTDYVATGTTTATPVANTTVAAAGTIALNVATTTVSGTVVVPQPPASNSAGVVASISGLAFNGSAYGPVSAAPSATSGTYSFGAVVPPGNYSVTLSLAAFNPAIVSGVTVVAGLTTTVPTTTLGSATGTITGTVTASAGSTGIAVDASSVLISITGAGLTTAITGTTTPAGTYSISGVPVNPAGTPYTITASKANYVAAGTTTATPVANTSVAAAGTIALSVATSLVSGTVTVPSPAANSAGVTATISGIAFNGSAYGPVSASPSGTTGTYSFGSVVPPGTYSVTLSLAAYNSTTLSGIVVVAGSSTTVPAATLSNATGTITGTVAASANGTGIAVDASSVLITISGAWLSTAVTGTTTPAGTYSISGVPVNPSGTPYTITATKSNYVASGTTTATAVANAAVAAAGTITMSVATTTVSGTVIVPSPPAVNAAGVVASIAGVAFNGSSYAPAATATSLAAGTYSFGATVPPGTYSVTLSLAGFTPVTLSGVNVTAGQAATVPTTTLVRAAGTVYGTIAVNANGTGLTLGSADLLGASVTVAGTNLSSTGTTTDSSGNWTINSVAVGVPAGTTYTATASKLGFTSASVSSVSVTANTNTQVSGLTLNVTPYSVGGTVTVQGLTAGNYGGVSAALSGVAFDGESYSTATVLTNSSGAFSISNVPAGTYSVTLTKSTSYTPLVISPVVVGPGSSATSLTGTLLRASGAFTGTIAVTNGTTGLVMNATDPGGFAVVVSDASFGTTTYSTITTAAGTFTIAGIPAPLTPSATYLITASKAGFTNATANVVLNPSVTTTAAGTLTATVTAYALAANATVVSPATTPAGTTATISGVAFNGSAFTVGSTTAVQDGTNTLQEDFTFSNLPTSSGTYTLTFAANGFTSVSVPVAIPASSTPSVTFSTRSTGTVTGVVSVLDGGTGLPIAGSDKQGIVLTIGGGGLSPGPVTTTDSTGTFTFLDVPATISGTYAISLTKGADWLSTGATFTVAAGATTTVTGLSLTVNPGSLPVTVQLNDFENEGNPATYTSVPVSLSGITFNGVAWGPVTFSSNSTTGFVNFPTLPPGSYSVSAVLPQHGSASSSGITVPPGGSPTTVVLTLADTAPPTAPVIAASTASPTSATSTSISIVTASTDPTSPVQNFDDYTVWVNSNLIGGSSTPVKVGTWNGAGSFAVTLVPGDDNYISVYGVDWNGNQSTAAQLMIHSENRLPPAPANIHVDNRPGSVRLTWSAVTNTTSLPVAGYKVYYGPQQSTSGSAYTGTSAAEGASPIVVGNVTEFNLTGLSNNSAFYVAITAYDTVTNPTPNESLLSTSYLANPNTAPFDRTVHQGVGQFANSIAVLRDDFLVSTGPGPAASLTNASGFLKPANNGTTGLVDGAFTITPYSYQQYGSLVTHPTGSSALGRKLVADTNRVVYAFDPGDSNYAIAAQPGFDIIDAGNLTSGITVPYQNQYSGYYFDHIVPAHRSGIGVVTFRSGTTYYIQAFSQNTDHVGITLSGSALALHTQTVGVAPFDVQVIGNYVFVLQTYTIDVYTLTPATPSVAYTSELATTQGYPGRSMAINGYNPLIVYYTGGGETGSGFNTGDNTILYGAYASSMTPLTLMALSYPATLAGQADKITIAGDLLLVQESPGFNTTAMESFSLADSYYPVLNGNYDLNVGLELGYSADAYGMGTSGSSVFLLNQSTYYDYYNQSAFPYYFSTVDVVEMGGPRSIVRQNGFVGLSNDAAQAELFDVLAVQTHGTRAIGLAVDNSTTISNGFELVNANMVGLFGDLTTDYVTSVSIATPSASYPPQSEGAVWCQNAASGICVPFAVYGDYAFVDKENAGSHSILMYDVALPTADFASVGSYTPTTYPTAFAVANDYLYVTESNTTNNTPTWLERFDLTRTAASVTAYNGGGAALNGYSIDIFGDYAYVGIQSGYCIVNLTTYSTAGSTTCYTPTTLPVIGISVDAERLLYTTPTGTGSTSTTLVNLSAPSTVVATYGTPSAEISVGFFMTGPNLYQTSVNNNPGGGPNPSPAQSALAGYDMSSGSYVPLDTDPFIRSASEGAIGRAGSLVVVPDQNGGMVLERIY